MNGHQPDLLDDLARTVANGQDADTNPHSKAEIMPHKLTDKQRFNWLRLIRCENVGPATFRDLFNHYGSAEKALAALPELSQRGGAKKSIRIATESEIRQEWEEIYQGGARLVALGEPDYPHDLAFTHAPPPLLTIVGDGKWAQKTTIAMVGSRNCSASGIHLTEMLSKELGQHGLVVASGLARGIDTAAHKASLGSGTIAVLAGGLNRLYPKENIPLAHEIARHGMLISEMPWNWQARARDFPRRNRIISGISAGTLVIEAARKSGSLITARYALEQGREVFAIPGSPLDPRSGGTNHLIKEGACLVRTAEDILEALAYRLPYPDQPQSLLLEKHDSPDIGTIEEGLPFSTRERFVQSLSPTPIEIDQLIRLSGLTAGQTQLILLELDLAGRLERHGNQSVSLKPSAKNIR